MTTGIRVGIAAPLLAGAAVAVALGVYANVHEPTGRSYVIAGFSSTVTMKNWLATAALALVATQLAGGSWMARSTPTRPAPGWLPDAHRLVGTLAFALTLPVAFHCLWSLGYQTGSARVAAHSLLGCAAYGAFAAKFAVVRRPDQPRWALPAAGGLLAVVLVATWWTSALWFFTNVSWST